LASDSKQSSIDSHQTTNDSKQSAIDSHQTTNDSKQSAIDSHQTASDAQALEKDSCPLSPNMPAGGGRNDAHRQYRPAVAGVPAGDAVLPVVAARLSADGAPRELLLTLETDEGIKGYAAGVAFLREGAGLKDLLLPFLFGRDPMNVEEVVQIARSATFLGLRLWWIEMAFWDIIGKAVGQPVYRLLGGYQERVKAYASTGELREPSARLEYIAHIREMGFRAVKIRFHSWDWREDLAVVRAIRKQYPDMEIMVDANMGWRVAGMAPAPKWDLATALRVAEELGELGVRWLEEPLDKHDYEGYRRLREKSPVPLASGEMNQDLHEFREYLVRDALDVLQPDVSLSGGILLGKKIAALAEAFGKQIAPHTWTSGLGLAANLQLMGACPNCEWAEFPYEPPGWDLRARDYFLTEPIVPDSEGYLPVPSKPGLGVEVDEEAVARYTVAL
jgi:D-galactarolactone cycloisomerase